MKDLEKLNFDEKLEKLKKLKEEGDAVILAHYYVNEDIQAIADYIGDSFFLAQKATELKKRTIVMAGVYFMGESVKILNPSKTVLMPDIGADCPMAHMISVEKIKEMREKYEDLAVVTYINSTAEIKAYSDICVTSSNAAKIVNKLKEKNIFFVPDKNLGNYIKKSLPNKNVILNDGCCPVHDEIDVNDVRAYKGKVKILAHPECRKEILDLADFIGSTKAIIKESGKYDDVLVVTEEGIFTELKKKYPNINLRKLKKEAICNDMKKLTVDKVIRAIKNNENQVEVDKEISKRALIPLKRMLELGA
ncbi:MULTISPECIES: quinolinate synthase NadA [Peptoniphilus]|uniref:quinolinate synthase NadA n=1 Tax=Peptoniphilus TaxID=162289 RepID=UPI0002886D0E|nr:MULTISPECIES: quinolinate synthase NadA [Peptoniphilus]MBS6610353.1 quinolinate synthase NadA [Peptoniphilus harei]MDU2109292.1 quinolinate synthase NadA [Peptoniphilus lacydonensis]MDU2115404.1 quinolinate synthase NadA [Peptoniphilus lacydonensis]MDU3750956.1 quinolinate synthase NadA [Peptoniphilus rhinitidis]MDU5274950.1 quinolinate synthase NadA [Peptoniphilus lacydonensis]